MEYTTDYLLESFPRAARHLATGEGDARKRVWTAYLAIHHFSPERLPDYLRDDFRWVLDQLTKRDPQRSTVIRHGMLSEEGKIEANLRTMTNKTAARIADRIYTMYQKILTRAYEPGPGNFRTLPHLG